MKHIVFTSFLILASVNGRKKDFSVDGYYNLIEKVLMHDTSKDPVGYQITGNLEVRRVHSTLFSLKIHDMKLHIMSRKSPTPHGFITHSSNLDSSVNNPFLINMENGNVSHIYGDPKEQTYLINLKKGISSLFQFQVENFKTHEIDSSGNCAVAYTRNLEDILKVKTNCLSEQEDIRENDLWGGKLKSNFQTLIKLSTDFKRLENVIAKESHILKQNIAEFAETRVSSEMELIYKESLLPEPQYGGDEESVVDQFGTELGIQYQKFKLLPEKGETVCNGDRCPSISKVVQENRKHLQPDAIGTSKSALGFIRVVHRVKQASAEELYSILNSKENKKILPQLMDILGAANTEAAHQAALKILKMSAADYNLDLCERYFWALSLSLNPNEIIIKDLLQIMNIQQKDPKLWQTLVFTLSSMVKHISQKYGDEDQKLLEEVIGMITKKLQECKTDDETCRQLYLKAFSNIASPAALSVLLNFTATSTRKSAVTAIHAISKLERKSWNKDVLQMAEKIFLTNGDYDSSARTIALDILLKSNPSEQLVARLASILKYKESPNELKEYFLQRLHMISEMDEVFRKLVMKVLKSENLYHYNSLAQGGLSTAFSRTFMEGGSLSTMQEISKGILKRGNVHVDLHYNNITHTMFTLGIFSRGLNSFVSDDEDEDQEPASAGLELTVLDVGLRPFIFFTGNGELMGHIWSGTGSTKTPAYQALLPLGEKKVRLPLGIGGFADVMIFSVASVDLSGQIEISLWNRNAQSLVQNSAGITVQSIIQIDSSLVKTQVQSNLLVEPKLDLLSTIEFSDNVALCMQLQQSDLSVRYNTFKVERIPGSKHKLRKARYKTMFIPGKTYALNMKNNEMCNVVFKKS